MALLSTPICEFGAKMPDFYLKNVDGKYFTKEMCLGPNGTLIFFICNHCPYVKAIINELIETVKKLQKYGVHCTAIMPNDFIKYPEDNYENMKIFSKKNKFNFSYLIDTDQSIAKKFGAVCTPDFFGYNLNHELQYRGRLGKMENLEFVGKKNDLLDAMIEISKKNIGPKDQFPSAGCSIKWKTS